MRIKRPSIQSIPSKLVKWIYSLLILLAITTNTFGGQLPITRANSTRPAGCAAATFSEITDGDILKNTDINVCYYFKQTKTSSGSNSDSDCQGLYNMPADQFCVEILQPNTTTTGCPAPTSITNATLYTYQTTCFYLKTVKTICTDKYGNSSSPACTASKGSASSGNSTTDATAACSADRSCKQNPNCSSDNGQFIHTGYDDPAHNLACLYTNASITTCSSQLFYSDGSCFVGSSKSSGSPPPTSNGLRSNGCPNTPAGTTKTPAITPSVNSAVGNQCFYTPLGTTTCATNYQSIGTPGNTICVGYKNNAPPTAVNPANSQCPTSPNGTGTLYVLIRTCFFLAATNASCPSTNGYSFTVPDCYAVVTGNSNFSTNGCPIPSPATTVTPTPALYYQICYYQPASGSQCATNYNSGIAGSTDCAAYVNSSSPIIPVSGQCPMAPDNASTVYISFNGNRCYFLTKDQKQCTDPYNNFDEPVCWANPIIKQNGAHNSLDLDTTTPDPGCPSSPVNGIKYTPKEGNCTGDDGSIISTTCAQGYITTSDGKGCSFNASVDMPDVSSGPCTLKNTGEEEGKGKEGEEGGTRLYTCPYKNATLVCKISGSGSQTMEDCYMGKGTYDSTSETYDSSLSYYKCFLNPNNDPTSCWYYGPNSTAKKPLLAISTCTRPAGPGSSLSDCIISTCLDSSSKFQACLLLSSSNPQANPAVIQVSIEQQCTSQQDGVVLSCTYVYTGHNTIKSKYYQITCDQQTLLNCTPIDGPYGSNLTRNCGSQDDTFTSGCNTTDANNKNALVWRGSCKPDQGSSNNGCTLFDNLPKASNNLGEVHCSQAGTCTITDHSGNKMTLISCGTTPTYNCKSMTPGCPVTTTPIKGTTTAPLIEANLTCRGEVVMDSLMSPAITSLTIKYPLSEGELQYVLKAIGVGSQSWLAQPGEENLPGGVAGATGIVGL